MFIHAQKNVPAQNNVPFYVMKQTNNFSPMFLAILATFRTPFLLFFSIFCLYYYGIFQTLNSYH